MTESLSGSSPAAMTKAYDILLWLIGHAGKFLRSHQFTIGDRIPKRRFWRTVRAESFDTPAVRPEALEGDCRSSQDMLVEGWVVNVFHIPMSFWVYILRCADGSYYTGHTDDLEKRMAEHQTGELPGYASRRRPVTLVFTEAFPAREEALACERQIKGWSRRKKEAMMRGACCYEIWAEVSRLAKEKRRDDGLSGHGCFPSASSGRADL